MTLILDTDILSSLAKIERLSLLQKVFPNRDRLIPTGVYEELEEAMEIGYEFPEMIFEFTEAVSLEGKELEEYKTQLTEMRKLDKGELQCLIIAEKRGYIFLTNDNFARREGKSRGLKTYNLAEVVKAAHIAGELNEGEVKDMIKALEEKDNFTFANESHLYE
ncbi:MAG: hypothetical protein ACOC1V_05305 [Candidatus Saliniplasma sp.]